MHYAELLSKSCSKRSKKCSMNFFINYKKEFSQEDKSIAGSSIHKGKPKSKHLTSKENRRVIEQYRGRLKILYHLFAKYHCLKRGP